ncbi:hypothetical protein QZH41_007074 [Actinostola sp. cb2023]|nr:hypothetical protein QZH41_007074 [Actinostola sp. cb2023]
MSSEENPFFPQWTTFEWENITDNMRRAIEKTTKKASPKKQNPLSLESLEPDSEGECNDVSTKMNNISKLREITEGRYFNPAEILEEITTPADHPSQLVDALKVGLADILAGSNTEDRGGSDDEFSKSLDVSYDENSKNDPLAAVINNISHLLNRVVGSSESEDDVTDISTTESRESVYVESSTMDCAMQMVQDKLVSSEELNIKESDKRVVQNFCESETNEELSASGKNDVDQPDCEKDVTENKNDISSFSDVKPLKNNFDVERTVPFGKEKIEVQESSYIIKHEGDCVETTDQDISKLPPSFIIKDTVEGDTETDTANRSDEFVDEHRQQNHNDDDNWKRDITVEDIVIIENADGEMNNETNEDSELEVDRASAEATVDRQSSSPSSCEYSPETFKRTYADVLKAGLPPNAITHVKPLTFSLCCHNVTSRTAKESKRKSSKKKKDKRTKRSTEYHTRKEGVNDSSHLGQQGRTVSSITVSSKVKTKKDTQRNTSKSKSPVRKSPKKTICSGSNVGQCVEWDNDVVQSESSISDDASAEDILREKIKAEQIAKVLQDAKLTLAKLTSESLGSYERVSCLKQVPSANNNTFELLQSQEINKSKHMKELANHLHELTQMGLGNAKEFSEIKDILISLHYLQTKDKYFIEKNREKSTEKPPEPLTNTDNSLQLFIVIVLLLILLMFIFKRQWFTFVCIGSFVAFFAFNQQKIFKYIENASKEKD